MNACICRPYRAQNLFLPSPRAAPGAIHLAGLSGRRKMCELMWANGHFIITTHLLTPSQGRHLFRALGFHRSVLLLI